MKFKELINSLLFLIAVPKCVSCGERLSRREQSLCVDCKAEYNNLLYYNCSVCGKFLSECTCSNAYLKRHYVHRVVKVFRYNAGEENAANKLIYNLKRENRDDVVEFLSSELHRALKNSDISFENYIITNVPRRKASIKKYGYDHSAQVAKRLAKLLGIKYGALLVSKAKTDQKKKHGRLERSQNATFDYKRGAPNIKGKNVILLDDIITTGSSMGASAMLLHGLGAKKIIGAAIAIAYKDDYIPFQFTYN